METEYSFSSDITTSRSCIKRLQCVSWKAVIAALLGAILVLFFVFVVALLYKIYPTIDLLNTTIHNFNNVTTDVKTLISREGGVDHMVAVLSKIENIINKVCFMLRC